MRYEKYKINKLFTSQNGDTDIKKSDITGTGVPVITSGVDKYGIMGETDIEARIIKENTITIDMFGNAFFRPFKYKMVTHARVFSMELIGREMTESIGLFLVSHFHWLPQVYNYSNMCSFNKIKDSTITLPTLDELDENSPYSDEGFVPDWDYMEKRVAELFELRVAELAAYLEETGLSDYILTEQEEEILVAEPETVEFKVDELFELTGVKQAKSQKLIPTKETGISYVVQSQMNNMVSRRVDKQYLLDNDEPICEGNVIVLGVTLPAVSYQPTEFGASQVITAYNKHLNEEVGLFLDAQLKQHMVRFSYSNKPGISKYKQLMLKLPIQTDEDNNPIIDPDKTYHPEGYIPDWEFMEKYIKAIEKVVIADVVKYKDEIIAKAKEVVG